MDQGTDQYIVKSFNHKLIDFEGSNNNNCDTNNSREWNGPFIFIQAADTQYGMIDSYIRHKKPAEVTWDEEIRLSKMAIEAINQMVPKPKFLVICGDLVDAKPGTENQPNQVVDFKRVFSKLDPTIPLVCVCGNHDIGDEPTMNTIRQYKDTFGDDYFYFVTNGVLFIVINSQFFKHRENVPEYAKEQDEWIEQIIAKAKDYKYTFVFQHIPWFLEKPNEDDDWANIPKDNKRLEWLEKLRKAGVNKIMCGHYHRNAGGWYEDLELVVSSAIGAQVGPDKSGLRVVRVLDKTIEHEYYAMEDIPKRIHLTETSSNLLSRSKKTHRKLLRIVLRYGFCGCI